MSRCFPFPPPGFESQLCIDLLEKEKHKEKKPKKEKRDGEKKEGKERKDKERSKDKHKEKKDHKEKHKDKKKDKDKDISWTSENKTKEQTESQHETKIGESRQKVDGKDSRFTEELGRRIRDGEKGAANSMAENFTVSFRRADGLCAAIAMEMGKVTGAEMVPDPTGISERGKDEKGRSVKNFVGSIERSEGVDAASALANNRGSTNPMVTNHGSTQKGRNHATGCSVNSLVGSMQEIPGDMCSEVAEKDRSATKVSNILDAAVPDPPDKEQRKTNGMVRQVVTIPRRVEGICTATPLEKGRGKDHIVVPQSIIPVHGRNDGMGDPTVGEKGSGKGIQMVARNISLEQTRNNIFGGPMEKNMDNSMEGKGKTRHKEADDAKADRNGDRDKNKKKNKGKDRDSPKEKEKEEKMRDKGKLKHKKERDKLKVSGKKDPVDNPSVKPVTPHEDNTNSDAKRKDFMMNGYLHENDARPNKLLKTSSLLHHHLENGRKTEPCHMVTPVLNGAVSTMATGVPESKDHTNGVTGCVTLSVGLRPPAAADSSKKKVQLKPPHQDSKYLDQIYSVPKLEELPEFDDQEWLFGSNSHRTKTLTKFDTEEIPRVWDAAMQIDAVDAMALPYVIPF